MLNRIEVAMKQGRPDPAGAALQQRLAEDLHLQVDDVRVIDVYTIHAELAAQELERVRTELLTDPIIQESCLNHSIARDYDFLIEVGFRPGVTDNIGRIAKEGIEDTLGRALRVEEAVYKSTQYALRGVDDAQAVHIARDALANDLIQQWAVKTVAAMAREDGKPLLALPIVTQQSDPVVHEICLELPDGELVELSRRRMLALDLAELQAIQAQYRDPTVRQRREATGLPDQPTDIELEILAQTWSEHCKHKIFNAAITYTDPSGATRVIDGLFKTYVKAATDEVAKRVDWMVSVFHDNAGIIRFDEDHLFALKVETHNSPSALDPYGGAMTGIVGVNRDILGAGLGCRCIFNTDVFCFATPYFEGATPPRLFHPRRVLRGVHAGVRDGGNQSGIPTINGAIVFHERFLGKPLVFCGTGGLIPREVAGRPAHEKAARPGDLIVMVGGRIGKDGIHGATFSSEELHEGSPATAVQIGDPITQKKMSDFLLEARDLGLFSCITDNGAGGLSSSIGEMAKDPGGAEVHLDRAPLKYAGLAPWEVFLSEAQERMTLAVPPAQRDAFLRLAMQRSVEATVLGEFTDSGLLECYYEGKCIAQISMDFLHNGVPRMHLEAALTPAAATASPPRVTESNLKQALLSVLGSLNVCSKEQFVRMYDHEVQGQSVLKPFQGSAHDGPGDAGVIRPLPNSKRGIAVACGITPKYSDLDAYHMMACAVDEAVRNLVCVGARLGHIAGLDNFCWPDPVESDKNPDGAHKLAQLVRCCQALYDTCVAYDIPLISGKDSMKNDYRIGDTKISIPPTVLFTAAAVLEDVERVVSMDAKQAGDLVYVLGETREELGGSEYFGVRGLRGGAVPQVDTVRARRLYDALAETMEAGLVASCHDCSDGGLAVALAETAFAGGLGMALDLGPLRGLPMEAALFSETPGRFVATIRPENQTEFEARMQGQSVHFLGRVTGEDEFNIARDGQTLVRAKVGELKQAWQRPLQL
ncbi:MAG: phosphoribosylformylglycinamidine synthase subunit PurL [Candidatus Hydrogenedentes bacterium]|nr:phosphoribosylformylglycinamidine synthase subunit PurL [Candidatus Hydrogenedentota bacterium]